MRTLKPRLVLGFFLIPLMCLAAPATPSAEIRVTLFEQPCLLRGPVAETILKNVHAISPEQMYPSAILTQNPGETSESLRKALDKLKKTTPTPTQLDRYRDRLTKRFSSQLAFFEGLQAFKQTGQPDALLEKGKRILPEKKFKNFEAQVKKKAASGKAGIKSFEPVLDLFNESIEADPEEEFHRAIRNLDIHYVCNFGDTEDSEE
ncbi:hypothetical protein WDW86_20280 [Bdellovibrionota bacterium FG-2]